jgi:hypothetical protein
MKIYGASDDLIEIDDCKNRDEIGYGSGEYKIRVGTKKQNLIVTVRWEDNPPDNESPWQIRVTGHIGGGFPYHMDLVPDDPENDPMLVIDCPHDTPWLLVYPIPDEVENAWDELQDALRRNNYTLQDFVELTGADQ